MKSVAKICLDDLNSDLRSNFTLSIRNVIKNYWKRPTTIALQNIFAGSSCANSVFMLKKIKLGNTLLLNILFLL